MINNRLLLTFCFTFFLFGGVFAQYEEAKLRRILANADPQELVSECTQMMQEGYLYQAGRVADKLLEQKPTSCNYNFRRGFIHIQMNGDYIKALPLLEKSVSNLDKNFDAFSANEESAPTDALYFLGKCYHLDEQLDKAVEYYNRFIKESNPKSEYILFANLGIKQCEVAKKAKEFPKKVLLKNVGGEINTKRPEYSPVISLDGSALYFTSRRDWANGEHREGIDPRINLPAEDIYVSYRDFDSSWTTPFRLDLCDPLQNEATMAVSSDERRVYLYQDTKGNGDIFYSDFSTNKFKDVFHYEVKKVNTSSWEPHCTVTPDGLTMYFVSDRKGGYGGRDIYRIVKLPTGEWSEPINVGPTINTAFDEDSPFIAIDNKTLYFSSNCERSMGGFDVFVSVRDENEVWSPPINLGYPLNSTGDDLFYTTTIDGLTGYLTSFRKNGYGEKDIYEIQNDYMGVKQIAVLKGKIKTVNDEPLPDDIYISLKCTNCANSFERKLYPRLRDGVFLSSLEPCRTYEISFSYDKGKKQFYSETFETNCNTAYQEVYREVLLDTKERTIVPKKPDVVQKETPKDPIKEPIKEVDLSKLSFKHYFDYNANQLDPLKGDLSKFLKEVESSLNENRTSIQLKIYSSASEVTSRVYKSNEELALLRANNLKNMLEIYYSRKKGFKGKVKITVESAIVSGPTYIKDFKDTSKYKPYQYVEVKVE